MDQMRHHMDGMLVAPVMVSLLRSGFFENPNESGRNRSARSIGLACRLLAAQGWLEESDNRHVLTDEGQFAVSRGHTYGITVSYLLMFAKMSELLFGDAGKVWDAFHNKEASQVDRAAELMKTLSQLMDLIADSPDPVSWGSSTSNETALENQTGLGHPSRRGLAVVDAHKVNRIQVDLFRIVHIAEDRDWNGDLLWPDRMISPGMLIRRSPRVARSTVFTI